VIAENPIWGRGKLQLAINIKPVGNTCNATELGHSSQGAEELVGDSIVESLRNHDLRRKGRELGMVGDHIYGPEAPIPPPLGEGLQDLRGDHVVAEEELEVYVLVSHVDSVIWIIEPEERHHLCVEEAGGGIEHYAVENRLRYVQCGELRVEEQVTDEHRQACEDYGDDYHAADQGSAPDENVGSRRAGQYSLVRVVADVVRSVVLFVRYVWPWGLQVSLIYYADAPDLLQLGLRILLLQRLLLLLRHHPPPKQPEVLVLVLDLASFLFLILDLS